MTELKPNHAKALMLAAGVLPDFEVIEAGSIDSSRNESIVLWPLLDVLTINFKSSDIVLHRIDIIRSLVDMGLVVKQIGFYACFVDFVL